MIQSSNLVKIQYHCRPRNWVDQELITLGAIIPHYYTVSVNPVSTLQDMSADQRHNCEPWYHGKLVPGRDTSDRLLKQYSHLGNATFLVRESDTFRGSFTLSFWYGCPYLPTSLYSLYTSASLCRVHGNGLCYGYQAAGQAQSLSYQITK